MVLVDGMTVSPWKLGRMRCDLCRHGTSFLCKHGWREFRRQCGGDSQKAKIELGSHRNGR